MKRIITLGLLITICFFCETKAQSLSTKIVRIEIDGKEVKKSYKVFFLSNRKWVESKRTSTGFIVPSELKTEEYLAVLFVFRKYKLEFSKVHISKFAENWIVGVDKKPFSDEFVPLDEAKTTIGVYYIKFEGNGLVTRLIVTEKNSK